MNKNVGRAMKGSRYCLQNYMVKNPESLSNMILLSSPSLLSFTSGQVNWISPNPQKDFYEYRDDFLSALSLSNVDLVDMQGKLRNFWPKNGPQWDGLATVNGKSGEKGVLLIEAKAHVDETKSSLKATSKSSIDLIKESMRCVQEYMGIAFSDWTTGYYQLANRISYLYFMNEIAKIPTWLVLINFIGDKSYKETGINEWIEHYDIIYKNMGLNSSCKLSDKIILVFPESL